jgi:IS5 family transposase
LREGDAEAVFRARESVIRCLKCNYMDSCTAYTPLHHLKLPLWVFSYLLIEAVQRFPLVLSAEEIRRKLGVAKSTSTLLKRRLQVFLSDLQPRIKEIIVEEIQKNKGLILPEGDVSSVIRGKTVVSIDGHALFSATQRANGGRARWKHGGQTASVYLTDEVAEQKGKYQIGTLCHTLALKKGPIILDSVPTFKQKHIQPLLEFLPENTPVFSDDGYPWYRRYNLNHRSVNHSARAKDRKRSLWARDRWSRFGVHNNVAEGNGRILKHAFIAGYSYVSPEKSKMYLNEFSSLKAIRIYSLSGLGNVGDSVF